MLVSTNYTLLDELSGTSCGKVKSCLVKKGSIDHRIINFKVIYL